MFFSTLNIGHIRIFENDEKYLKCSLLEKIFVIFFDFISNFVFTTFFNLPRTTDCLKFFITIYSYFILNIKIGLNRIFSIFVGFSGTLLIIKPEFNEINKVIARQVDNSVIICCAVVRHAESTHIFTRIKQLKQPPNKQYCDKIMLV